jgi:hypothetical protein
MFAQTRTIRNFVQTPTTMSEHSPNGSRDSVTIRRSGPGDGKALGRLALLDDRRLAAGPHVVAERAGEIIAAAPLEGGATIANPFIPTADFVSLIELRARQLPT